MIVGQWPSVLAVVSGGGCLDTFLSPVTFISSFLLFFSLSGRLKYNPRIILQFYMVLREFKTLSRTPPMPRLIAVFCLAVSKQQLNDKKLAGFCSHVI